MKPLSFRLRIALLSALISGLVLVGFGAMSWYLLYQQKIESVDTELRALGTRHPGWLANRANFDRFNDSLQFIFGQEQEGKVIFLVKDAQGKTLFVSPRWPGTVLPSAIDCSLENAPAPQIQTATRAEAPDRSGQPRWGVGKGRGGAGRGLGPGRGGSQVVFNKIPRFLTVQNPQGCWRLGIMGNDELRLVVGLSFDAAASDLRRMRSIFLVTLPAALLLVGAGGWLVAGRALRPLRSIAQTAERVTAHGLDQRIPASHEDREITRLIGVFNGMMDRLEASFRQATRFSADASHELKTPLTIMQGELETALHAAVPGSPEQQVFANLLEETHRLKTITRGLLLLAQADAGQLKLALEEVNLSTTLDALIEDALILAAGLNLHFDLEIQPDLRLRADRALLQMAILNLLDNAVKYNELEGSVGVSLTPENGSFVLTVCSTGPGIPREEQPKLFSRFYRGDCARQRPAEGFGLGLSLAREIVRAHGGELTLRESRPGRTCFELRLPAARITRL